MDFYMGKGQYMDGTDTDMLCELACQYHELEVTGRRGRFVGDVLGYLQDKADLVTDGLTVEQGDGFDVRVMQDGACVAVFPIEAYTDSTLVPCSWDMADSM